MSSTVARMGRARKLVDKTAFSGRVALRIRELREARQMTVEDLAERAGVTVNNLYAWESHRRVPSIDVLAKLAKALGCKTPADFFPPKL